MNLTVKIVIFYKKKIETVDCNGIPYKIHYNYINSVLHPEKLE